MSNQLTYHFIASHHIGQQINLTCLARTNLNLHQTPDCFAYPLTLLFSPSPDWLPALPVSIVSSMPEGEANNVRCILACAWCMRMNLPLVLTWYHWHSTHCELLLQNCQGDSGIFSALSQYYFLKQQIQWNIPLWNQTHSSRTTHKSKNQPYDMPCSLAPVSDRLWYTLLIPVLAMMFSPLNPDRVDPDAPHSHISSPPAAEHCHIWHCHANSNTA